MNARIAGHCRHVGENIGRISADHGFEPGFLFMVGGLMVKFTSSRLASKTLELIFVFDIVGLVDHPKPDMD